MILTTPPEPKEIKDWMMSLKNAPGNSSLAANDTYIIWAGNKIPKYLWDAWKNDLKELGFNWQRFTKTLRHRTDVAVQWYQGGLLWGDFCKKISDLLNGPIGSEVASNVSTPLISIQDLGSSQLTPISDWQKFERFCRDLWASIWENEELQRHGRTGQAQAGVDIFGEIKREKGNLGGIQCKRKDAFADDVLTVEELQKIVKDAKKFLPGLSHFIVAYTGRSDAKLQEEARKITEKNISKGLFTVKVFSWDDISDIVGRYPALVEAYGLIATSPNLKLIRDIKNNSESLLEVQAQNFEETKVISREIKVINQGFGRMAEQIQNFAGNNDLTGEYNLQLDSIRDLIDASFHKEAFDQIVSLEKRIKNISDPVIKFRIATNKAATLLALGKEKDAAFFFIEAWQYNPNDEKALCNKSLGFWLLDQFDEALATVNDVLRKNPLSQRAYELLILNAKKEETLEAIIEKVPQVLRKNESIAHAISQVARERGLEEETIKWLEVAIENSDPKKVSLDLQASLAAALLQVFEKRYDVQLGIQLTDVDKRNIEKALELLNNAINSIKNSQTLVFRTNWLGNRAVGYKLLGKLDEALATTEWALELSPNNPIFLKQKAFLLHSLGKSDKAVEVFREILNDKDVPEAALLLGGIFYEQFPERDNEAISIIEQSLKKDKDQLLAAEEKRLLIHLFLRNERFNDARKIVEQLRSFNPTNISDLIIAARIEKLDSHSEIYTNLLDQARTYITSSTDIRSILELADEFYHAKRFSDAYPLYEKITDIKIKSPLVDKLIFSYYKAELYQKAQDALRAVPEKNKNRFLYELEISILNNQGALKEAIKILEIYLQHNPNDLAFKIKWAISLFRDGQMEKLDKFLSEKIDVSNLPDEVKFQCISQIGWLLIQRNKIRQALDVGYNLLRIFHNNADAQVAYISLAFQRNKSFDSDLSSETVGLDTAVTIEENGNTRLWIIEDNPGPFGFHLSPDNAFSKILFGKRVGDEFCFKEDLIKIINIQSKYIYAFQQCLDTYHLITDDQKDLPIQRFKVPESPEEFREQIKKKLDPISEHVSKVEKLYLDHKITLGTFSHLINRNPVTVWGGLINNINIGLQACLGDPREVKNAGLLIREMHDEVVLDLSALLTCAKVGCLDLLENSFSKIFVSQSVIDEINEEIIEKESRSGQGFETLYKEEGEYRLYKVSSEEINQLITFLRSITDWARKENRIIPVNSLLIQSRERTEKLYKVLGKSFTDSILIAKERNCLLYSDDLTTRQIAEEEFGVKGFWTQVFATEVLSKESGLSTKLEEVNIALCSLNYHFTMVSGQTLFWAGKTGEWQNYDSLKNVLRFVSSTQVNLDSIIHVLINFFFLIWKDTAISDFQKETLVFLVLDAVAQNQNRLEIAKKISFAIPNRLPLLPVLGQHLLRLVAAWRSIRG